MKRGKLALGVLAIFLAATIFTGIGTVFAADKAIRLTVGTGKPIEAGKWISSVRDFFVAEVSKRVKAKTNYRIKWTEAYSGSVAKAGAVLEAVEIGLLDIGFVVWPFEPAKLFLNNYNYWVPFGSSDLAAISRIAVKLNKEYDELGKIYEKKYNQKLLGISSIASYQLITTFPVNSLSDLKGRKIAAAGPNLYIVKAAGAVPVQSGIEEAYTSFKTGVYDGWLIMEDIMAGLKWPEVAPYVTLVDLGAVAVGSININLDTWKNLPAEVRNIIQKVGDEYSLVEPKMVADSMGACREKIKSMGGKFFTLPAEERAQWTAALPNQPNIKAKEADAKGLPGSAVMRSFIEYQKQEGYKFPREWTVD